MAITAQPIESSETIDVESRDLERTRLLIEADHDHQRALDALGR